VRGRIKGKRVWGKGEKSVYKRVREKVFEGFTFLAKWYKEEKAGGCCSGGGIV
jgi:hypothetical protein